MSIAKKWRGIAAGLFLGVATLGTMAAASPSQAADVRFGIVVADRDYRPPVRYERIPAPPRYVSRADWHPGHWERYGRHWEWRPGYYYSHFGHRYYR